MALKVKLVDVNTVLDIETVKAAKEQGLNLRFSLIDRTQTPGWRLFVDPQLDCIFQAGDGSRLYVRDKKDSDDVEYI